MSIDLAGKAGSYRPPAAPGKWQPLGPRKTATRQSMHKLAGQLKDRHTGLGAHQHVTDAAHALDRGDHDAAIRHLNAGIANLTPQSMLRHGFTNDADHIQAKISMDDIHRHLLLVKDIQESAARNQDLVKAQVPPTQEDEVLAPPKAAGAPGAVPPPTAPGVKAPTTPPPAPGAAAKTTPPAPGTAGPAPAPQVASAPQPGTASKPPPKAVAASNGEVITAIELIGPKGSSHGWQQQTPTAGDHEKAARLHLRAAAGAKNPAVKAKHVKIAAVHQQIAAKLRTVNGTVAAAEGGPGGGGDRVNGVEQELAGLPTDQIDLAAAHPPYRFKHGWVPVEGGDTPGRPREDPPSITTPGGGRKGWLGKATQLPQRMVKKDYPDIAKRMRQVTPQRVQQAQFDENRIAGGLAPLHPELAQIFPATYGKHALSGPALPLPKPERVKHDPSYVTGIVNPRAQPIISALRARNPSAYAFATELSAKTGTLATVSTPISGKPGGPGLWHQKGMGLPPYIRNIAKAIMRKRGMDESHAIAIAKASTSKWAAGGGKVKPEVRAASAATNVDWAAKRARAHAHANAGDHARAIIELTGTAAGAAADTKSTLTGQFVVKGSQQQQPPKGSAKAKASAKATIAKKAAARAAAREEKPKAKAAAHKEHLAHLAHLAHDPKAAGYEKTAATDRAKAKALGAQLKLLKAALASASGKVTKGQSGSTTSSSAPAVKKAAAAAPAATTTTTGAAKGTTAAAPVKPGATPTAAQLKTAIAGLTKQIAQLNAAAATATKQAQ